MILEPVGQLTEITGCSGLRRVLDHRLAEACCLADHLILVDDHG